MTGEDLKVHVTGPADRDDQARLFARCFSKPTGVEALRWKYDGNPHGRAVSLVLRDADQKAVCSYAYVPRIGRAAGQSGLLGQQSDVMTDPDFQRLGLARRLVEYCARETAAAGFVVNWGFPNRQSAPVFLKFGWKSAGKIRPRRCILKADAAAKQRRLGDGRLAALKLGLDRRASSAKRRSLGDLPAGFELRVLTRFDAHTERIVELSEQVESRFGFMLPRDARYLDWRFVDTPSQQHACFGLFDGDDIFQGYVVIQAPTAGGAESVGYLVDLLCGEEDLVAPLMAAALEQLETMGSSVVEAWSVDGSWWMQRLVAAGFHNAKPDNHLFVYYFANMPEHALVQAMMDASTWYLTDGDRDDEMMG